MCRAETGVAETGLRSLVNRAMGQQSRDCDREFFRTSLDYRLQIKDKHQVVQSLNPSASRVFRTPSISRIGMMAVQKWNAQRVVRMKPKRSPHLRRDHCRPKMEKPGHLRPGFPC
jgi:hypothetical protein